MKKLYLKHKEVILYLIFGVLTTLVNMISYYLSVRILHVDYQFGNILAWIISVTFAFLTNKFFVFESKGMERKEMIKEFLSFYGFRIVSLGIDIGVMYLMVSMLSIDDMIAKIVSNGIIIVINYIFSKLFTFKKSN